MIELDQACMAYREWMSALRDGEAPEAAPAEVGAHGQGCPACRAFTEQLEELDRRLGHLRTDGPDLTDRLVGALTGSGPPGRRTTRPRERRLMAAGAALTVLALVLALVTWREQSGSNHPAADVEQVAGPTGQNSNYPGLVASPKPYGRPDVSLTDTEGQPYQLGAPNQKKLTLMYFGYTHCPDICPLSMALTAQALADMPAADARQVQVVFVTTDPDRDTPGVIRQWLDHFNSSFIGVTGTIGEIHTAEAQVGMPLSYADPGPGGSYEVVHAGYTLIFTPDGLAHLFYESNASPRQVAGALEKLTQSGYQA